MRLPIRVVLVLCLMASMLVVTTGSAQVPSATASNTTPITINDVSAATPFPSTIETSGLVGTVTAVTVTLTGLSHTCPWDLDILLVGPTGAGVLLLSDVGTGLGCPPSVEATLTFDDAAATLVPYPPVTGTYLPTNEDTTTDDFTLFGGPSGTFGTSLSVFNATDPNGTWSLYVVDQNGGDTGQISGGWSLTINGVYDVFDQMRADTIALVNNSSAESTLVALIDQAQDAYNDGNGWGAYVAMLKFVIQMNMYTRSRIVPASVAQQLLPQARDIASLVL